MTPDLICRECQSPRLEQTESAWGDQAWWRSFECQDCGATGEVEDRHDGPTKYHGDVTTPRREDLRELSAKARGRP